MLTEAHEERLLVTSDVHLGSVFLNSGQDLLRFLHYAQTNNYNICINGDGLDLVHTSLTHWIKQFSKFLRALKTILRGKTKIYYVVGNHDIILEHVLDDWGMLRVIPFLNVLSGEKRIRIEHGHLYDPFFVKHPYLFEFSTRMSYHLLWIYPGWYKIYRIWLMLRYGYVGQNRAFLTAAQELLERGFDVVIFGHTHHQGIINFHHNRTYINTGSWYDRPHYVSISNGEVQLQLFTQP